MTRLPDATLKEACRAGEEAECLYYGYFRDSLRGFPVQCTTPSIETDREYRKNFLQTLILNMRSQLQQSAFKEAKQNGAGRPLRPFDAQLQMSDRRSIGLYDARFHSTSW